MSRILAVMSPSPAFTQPPFIRLQPALYALDGGSRISSSGRLSSLLNLPQGCLAWKGAGAPAMARRGSLGLVMDGMIYNGAELAGADAPQQSDAELILTLTEKYGVETALMRLNGDFALALHDARDGSLLLARDRMGLRPLYYAQDKDFFAAASRPGALLALGIPADINPTFSGLFAASHYRTIDNDIHASPYAKVRQLPAGHLLQLADGGFQVRPWWIPLDEDDWNLSEEELKERYRELFLDAVALRLRRFRRPLFTLSGGMDSSSILAAARHLTGNRQQAISTVYQDPTYDESGAIRLMLDANVARWHTVTVGDPDVFALVRKMIGAHDEPVATATWLPHWLLCRETVAVGADAVSSGLGGDELFGGEYEHFFFYFADLYAAGRHREMEHEINCWARLHHHPLYPKNAAVAHEGIRRLTAPGGICLPDRNRLERYLAALRPDYFDLRAYTPVMDHPFDSYLKNRCWQDILRETSPCCIRAQDRHGAAFGLPVFMPFFDPRLVDFMFRVPGHCKIRNGGNKYLARQAMRGILPDSTCDNIVKTGWNAPAHLWFSGQGREQFMDMLHSVSFRQRGIYHVPEVLRLADEHNTIVFRRQCREHHMMFLWQVLNLELWLQWVDQRGWLHE